MNRLVNRDGSIIVSAEDISKALTTACPSDKIFVDRITDDVRAYNEWCEKRFKPDFKIEVREYTPPTPEDHVQQSQIWNIPSGYKTVDAREYVLGLCQTPAELDRVNYEMALFEERELMPLLQLMIYLVDEFRKHKIVWGVGRGSSCASYVLFLIGIHKIDSIKYGLDVHEFLK